LYDNDPRVKNNNLETIQMPTIPEIVQLANKLAHVQEHLTSENEDYLDMPVVKELVNGLYDAVNQAVADREGDQEDAELEDENDEDEE
jgi:hypothetical protein